MIASNRGTYVKPRLQRIGSFEEITKATEAGLYYDGNYTQNNLVVPDQYDGPLS